MAKKLKDLTLDDVINELECSIDWKMKHFTIGQKEQKHLLKLLKELQFLQHHG